MFENIDRELSLCREVAHLQDDRMAGPLDRILTGYMLTIVHAEFEQAIKNAVKERCLMDVDAYQVAFMETAVERLIRSITISALVGYLGFFDRNCKIRFRGKIPTNCLAEVYYGNLEENRQAMAHQANSEATLRNVEEWLLEARSVVVAFRESLELAGNA